jgi:glycosyltransferase involved in cell wall biosynthesis
VCLSSQSWDDKMWTNKQHIMSRLAHEHRVIHVDHGLRMLPEYLWRRLRKNPADAWRGLSLLWDGVSQRDSSLYVADHWAPLCFQLLKKGNRLRSAAEYDLKVLFLKRFLEREGITDPIIWVYHPGFADAVRHLPRKLLVYDCVDNYEAFPNYRASAAWIRKSEDKLCKEADLVFTTSAPLYELRKPMNPENTYLVHNVGDADHFGKALEPGPIPDDIADISGPIIGFVGAMSDYKVNLEWLQYAADTRPDWTIVLIGPVGEADPTTRLGKLKTTPNIRILGHRDYAQLPDYCRAFDVAVIPYRINEYTESVFPIKFFEFLGTGKPVVASALPAIMPYAKYVNIAESAEEFVDQCELAMVDPISGQPERLKVAKENSWPKRIGDIMGHIQRKLSEKRSESART